jgi:hypothetical protein
MGDVRTSIVVQSGDAEIISRKTGQNICFIELLFQQPRDLA